MNWRIQPCHFADPLTETGTEKVLEKIYVREIYFFCLIFPHGFILEIESQLFVLGQPGPEIEKINPSPTCHQKISGNKKRQRKANCPQDLFSVATLLSLSRAFPNIFKIAK